MSRSPTPFVLLSRQRSGSTWVIDMLSSHPAVRAYSELFLAGGDGTPQWGGHKDVVFWNTYSRSQAVAAPQASREEILFRYLDELYSARDGAAAIGFKLMLRQADEWPEMLGYFQQRTVRVVHLIRGNLLDTVLSGAAADRRRMFHARSGQEVPPVRLRLDVADLVRRLEREEQEVDRARARFGRSGLPYHEVFYEELLADRGRFGPVLEFLEVEPAVDRLHSHLRRLNDAPRRELIENYDEVRAALASSRFEAFLE